jgi:hypothetical protein
VEDRRDLTSSRLDEWPDFAAEFAQQIAAPRCSRGRTASGSGLIPSSTTVGSRIACLSLVASGWPR